MASPEIIRLAAGESLLVLCDQVRRACRLRRGCQSFCLSNGRNATAARKRAHRHEKKKVHRGREPSIAGPGQIVLSTFRLRGNDSVGTNGIHLVADGSVGRSQSNSNPKSRLLSQERKTAPRATDDPRTLSSVGKRCFKCHRRGAKSIGLAGFSTFRGCTFLLSILIIL